MTFFYHVYHKLYVHTLSPLFQLQSNLSTPHPDQWRRSEESSDAELEALRAGLSAQSPAPQLMPSKRDHVCWECSERFETLHDLMEHFQQHKASGRCHLCQITFCRGASLAIHLDNAHQNDPLVCPVKRCSAQLHNTWHLNKHVELCHTVKGLGVKEDEEEDEEEEEEEEEVMEEQQLLREGQMRLPGEHLHESDHSYHSSVNIGKVHVDHTYNCRSGKTCPQYALSSAPLNARRTRAPRARVGRRSVPFGTSPLSGKRGRFRLLERTDVKPNVKRMSQRRLHSIVVPSNTAQGCENRSVSQDDSMEESAPIQWHEDEEFAEEEVGEGDESSDTGEEDNESEDDGESDSLPPGDSIYVPEEYVGSHSDSEIDYLDSESSSSDSSDSNSYTRGGKKMPSKGRKKANTGSVVKQVSTIYTSEIWQKCPHCGLGPYLDLRHHMVKCCSKGPDNCIKCWRAYGRNMEFICVDCKKTFPGSGSCSAHVCPVRQCQPVRAMSWAKMSAGPKSHPKDHPAAPTPVKSEPAPVPVITQPPQLYQIITLLPSGVIATQAQSTSITQTSVPSSASTAVLPNNAVVKAISQANPLVVQDTGQMSQLVLPSCPPTPSGSLPMLGMVGSFVAESKESAGNLGNNNVTLYNPGTSASTQTTIVTGIETTASTQTANQTVRSHMLLKPPGLAGLSRSVAKSPPGVVHIYTQNSPNTQVFVSSQTPPGTPASSIVYSQTPPGMPAPMVAHSQVPARMPVSTIAHSQSPSDKLVTVVCNRTRMPTSMVIRSQTPPGLPAPSAIRNYAPPGVPTSVRTEAPSGTSTPTAEVRGTLPSLPILFRIPGQGSNMFFVPTLNHPMGAASPSMSHFFPVAASGGAPGAPVGMPVLSVRVPAPPGASPQVALSSGASSKDSGHQVASQVSTTVPSQVSTSSVLPSQASVSNTVFPQVSVSSPLPSSQTSSSSSAAVGASVPFQVPNSASVTTKQPILSRVPTHPPATASRSSTSSSLVLTSASGPLRILFMFLNQSRELSLALRMKTRWHYKEVFTCRQCGAVSRQPSLVVLHRYRHRKAPRLHRCRCGRRFQARLHLLRHQLLHAEATRYICTPCGDSFEGARRLVRHKANCSRTRKISDRVDCWRPFVCTCGRRFVRPSALLWHKLNNSRHKNRARNTKPSHQNHHDVQRALPAT